MTALRTALTTALTARARARPAQGTAPLSGTARWRGRRGVALTMLLMLMLLPQYRLMATQSETRVPQQPVVDHDAPPETRLRVAPFLTFGAEIKVEGVWATHLTLDKAEEDDHALLTPEVALAVSFDPSSHFKAFLNLEIVKEFTLEGPDESPMRVQLAFKEAFVALTDGLDGHVELRLGRQTFDDDREWLFDEELDAVRVWYRWTALTLEGSVSRKHLVQYELFYAEERERIINYLLMGRAPLTSAHTVAAYVLLRDDHTLAREQPLFFGLQVHGTFREAVAYWMELAHVRGRAEARTLQGYGVDLGITYQLPLRWQPSVTVSAAFGSGDTDPTGRVDRSFRQTGLHDNEGTLQGIAKFKYYGELFDPELSNLLILTGGIGLRPTRTSSLDLVYHTYGQHTAAATLRDARLDAAPTGRNRRLGHEIDLIVGYEGVHRVKMTLALGAFIPGRAFPADADPALFARLEIEWSFGDR